ncbi:hypothetical protein [Kribbella sp. NPDC004875]|uniref:hypothetical protein n=1 Tax=Kribbella sp. NPDC004875 TaxID=3364107 RepID=UPI0036B08C7B
MIDEKVLQDRLTEAAAAQDDLLPRPVADDISGGRRRLRRHRLLTGAGVLAAAGAVAAATIGVTGAVRDAAQGEPPAAGRRTPVDAAAAQDAAAVAKIQGFDTLMKGLLTKHFDPGGNHLDFSTGPFQVGTQIGHHDTMRKVGWKVAGEKGEGMLLIGLSRSAQSAGNTCGSYSANEADPVVCHRVTLPNGRPATIGRQGKLVELDYLRPDGEFAYVAIDPVFRNNTEIPVPDVAITDTQLFAFVTDPALKLPPLTNAQKAEEAALQDFAPTPAQVEALAARTLGGKLQRDHVEDAPGELVVVDQWTKSAATATLEIGLDAAPLASTCPAQLSMPNCTSVKLPNGGAAEYAEGARKYQGGEMYVMGATYKQPDGDLASVRILYPGPKPPAGAITQAQLLGLVADRSLDR